MSLDVNLLVTQPTSVYDGNITHNLGQMARQVHVGNALTLYDVMWRPDEHGMKFARDIADYLDVGFNVLLSEPSFFSTFNPENGWGSYEGLVDFVYEYRRACWDNPDATIGVSR
jgi:hypothetical protein